MNRRPISKAALNRAHQIMHVAMRTPAEVADVFVNYSPHTERLYVSIHVGGWNDSDRATATRSYSASMTPTSLLKLRCELLLDLATARTGFPIKSTQELSFDEDGKDQHFVI